jgi:hypothetical protein
VALRVSTVAKNLKTALILVSVVLAFFVGVIVRHWLWPSA